MSALLWFSAHSPKLPGHKSNSQQITPSIPDGANPDHYLRIRSPRRRAVANETAVTLRKNKRFAVLVELSYVKLDWVWEVPHAILFGVPRTGVQLMLRAVSMEKIMEFYSIWGWDQAWGQMYQSLPGYLPWAGSGQDQNDVRPSESIKQGEEAGCSQTMIQPCRILNGVASDGDSEGKALPEADSTGKWASVYRRDDEEIGCSEGSTFPCTRQEMVYAGNAHCAALAKLLQEAQ